MAYATQLTIGTGSKVSLHDQSQDVQVSLTYQLEREDTDLLAIVQEKAGEVAKAHHAAWRRIRDVHVQGKASSPQGSPPSAASPEPAPPQAEFSPAAELEGNETDSDKEAHDEAEPSTAGQQAALRGLLAHVGWSDEQVQEHLASTFGCSDLEELTQPQATAWLLDLQRTEREKAQQNRANSNTPSSRRGTHGSRLNGTA